MTTITNLNGGVALPIAADNDVLPIVDVSDTTEAATGTTKKVSRDKLLSPLAPVVLTGSTTLTQAHVNRQLIVNSPTGVTLTIALESANGPIGGDEIYGVNIGAGVITLAVQATGTLNANALLPATIDQYSAFSAVRVATNSFVRLA